MCSHQRVVRVEAHPELLEGGQQLLLHSPRDSVVHTLVYRWCLPPVRPAHERCTESKQVDMVGESSLNARGRMEFMTTAVHPTEVMPSTYQPFSPSYGEWNHLITTCDGDDIFLQCDLDTHAHLQVCQMSTVSQAA